MNELIKVGELSTQGKISSLELVDQVNLFREQEGNRAKLQHKTMLEIIRDEFSDEISQQTLLPSNYISDRGKEYPMFQLSLNQAKQLLVRESKFVRKAVFDYIDKLEEVIKRQFKVPTTFREALLLAADQQAVIEQQQELIEFQQPKVEFHDAVTKSKDVCYMDEVAKILNMGIGRNNLFKFLRENKVLMEGNKPYQDYVRRGWFKIDESTYMEDGEVKIRHTTKVYQKGVDGIRRLLVKKYGN